MLPPRVSILIPTLNAEPDLARLLPVLSGLVVDGGFELRVVDSDSTDATRDLLAAAGAEVLRIDRADFRHGATRNLVAEGARGEFLLFLTQDAVPSGADFVTKLLRPFEDPAVAGATSRVLPHEDDDPLTARTVLDAPEADAEAVVWDPGELGPLDALPPEKRARVLRFNNVASCIRREVFREIPFPDVPFGEDSAWARAALEAGHCVAFAAESVVHHAHRYSPGQAFERYRVDAAFQRRANGFRVRPSLWSVARGILFEVREDARFIRRRRAGLGHLLRSPFLRGAQVLGQYFGSRGWNPKGGSSATQKFS